MSKDIKKPVEPPKPVIEPVEYEFDDDEYVCHCFDDESDEYEYDGDH